MKPPRTHTALAVDIGGTKLAAGVVSDGGQVLARNAVPVPDTDEPEVVWDALRTVIQEVRTGQETVCGIGSTGPMDRKAGVIRPLSIRAWRDGFPLRSRVQGLTGVRTFIENDAKAVALAEGWCGAARGERSYLGMVVSTGVGGGIVLDGRLLDGRTGNAGHIGHMVVVPGGRMCRCGARGCLDAEASGTAIASITGRPVAEADDVIIERSARLVGYAIATAATFLDLAFAVIGGSVALGFGERFFRVAQAEVTSLVQLDFARATRVVPAGLGPLAPIVGAGRVGFIGLYSR